MPQPNNRFGSLLRSGHWRAARFRRERPGHHRLKLAVGRLAAQRGAVHKSASNKNQEFVMINIEKTLTILASQRPVFHSEADFQHAFAWEIHRQLSNASIRLEFPLQLNSKSIHLDIWAAQNDRRLAIELKYKTRALSVRMSSEQFALNNQSAQDSGRYDFVKDVQRLEQITTNQTNTVGYAILLTNDSAYWTPSRDSRPVDSDFRIEEGRTLHGELQWGVGASEGTKHNREEALVLREKYAITWADYSQPSAESYGKFRYTVVEIHG